MRLKNDSFLLHFRIRWCHHCHDYQAFEICRQVLEFVVYNEWRTDWNGEKDNQNQLYWQVSVWIAVFCDWLTYFAPWSKITPAKLVVTSGRAFCSRSFPVLPTGRPSAFISILYCIIAVEWAYYLFVCSCLYSEQSRITSLKNLSMKLLCFAAYFVSFTWVLSPLSFRHANAQVASTKKR